MLGLIFGILLFAGLLILPPIGWLGWTKQFLTAFLCFVIGAGSLLLLGYTKPLKKRYWLLTGGIGALLIVIGLYTAADISGDIYYLKQPLTKEMEVRQIRADHGYRSTSYYLDVSSGEKFPLGQHWHRYFGKSKPLFSLKSGQKVKLTYLPHSEVILSYQVIPEKEIPLDQELIQAEKQVRLATRHFAQTFSEAGKVYFTDEAAFWSQIHAMIAEKEAALVELDEAKVWQKSAETKAYAAKAKEVLEIERDSLKNMTDNFDQQDIFAWTSEMWEVEGQLLKIDFPMLSYEEVD